MTTPDTPAPAPALVPSAPGVIGNDSAPAIAGEPTTLDPGGQPVIASPTDPGAAVDADADAAPDAVADPAAPAGPDKSKLLAEVKARKTSDARTRKALSEAEAAGASARELAEASNLRGVALLGAGEAERATAAFEWARDKDPSYPDPSFNLAKQTAMAGEVPETVVHLQEVHKRGGKALLKQVGYDPVFEAVKDDPAVQKIAK